jgi:ubiquitin-protein ligase
MKQVKFMPTLPEAVYRRRLESEYAAISKSNYKFTVDPSKTTYEFTLQAEALHKTPSSQIAVRKNHKFRIALNRNYPYAGGFSVVWLTPIFHPNINDKDGKVCIHQLNEWSASQTILSLVKGIEHMLSHPNVKSPLNVEAGEYFYFHPELIENKFGNLEKQGKPRVLMK